MVTEQDFELLESYLDGELADGEANALHRRLAAEADLASAFEGIKSERQQRQQVWQQLEPDVDSARRLSAQIVRAARRDDLWRRVTGAVRYSSAAAACLAVVFLAGWIARGPAPNHQPGNPANPRIAGVPTTDNSIQFQQRPYQVRLADSSGRVVAVQRFATLEEARAFKKDLETWQNQPNRVEPANIKLVAEEF